MSNFLSEITDKSIIYALLVEAIRVLKNIVLSFISGIAIGIGAGVGFYVFEASLKNLLF